MGTTYYQPSVLVITVFSVGVIRLLQYEASHISDGVSRLRQYEAPLFLKPVLEFAVAYLLA